MTPSSSHLPLALLSVSLRAGGGKEGYLSIFSTRNETQAAVAGRSMVTRSEGRKATLPIIRSIVETEYSWQ